MTDQRSKKGSFGSDAPESARLTPTPDQPNIVTDDHALSLRSRVLYAAIRQRSRMCRWIGHAWGGRVGGRECSWCGTLHPDDIIVVEYVPEGEVARLLAAISRHRDAHVFKFGEVADSASDGHHLRLWEHLGHGTGDIRTSEQGSNPTLRSVEDARCEAERDALRDALERTQKALSVASVLPSLEPVRRIVAAALEASDG